VLFAVIVGDFRAVAREDAPDRSQALVDTVVSSIRANYSQLKTVEAVVETTLLDSSVRARDVQKLTFSGGMTGTAEFSPKTTFESRFYCDGPKIRCDITRRGAAPANAVFVLSNEVWTEYKPGISTAWVRAPDQMPGLDPMDIRDMASPSLNETVVSVLQKDRTLSARLVATAKSETVVEITTQGDKDKREWTFNSAYAYLPTRWFARHPDGSIREYVRMEYRPVLEGTAWLPSCRKTFFFAKGATTIPIEDKWMQCLTIEVKEVVGMNRHIDESVFTLSLPDGTTVKDAVQRKHHVVGKEQHQTSELVLPGRRTWWVVISNIVVICVLLFAIVVIRRRVRYSKRRI
jgi:hypothetical protein